MSRPLTRFFFNSFLSFFPFTVQQLSALPSLLHPFLLAFFSLFYFFAFSKYKVSATKKKKRLPGRFLSRDRQGDGE